MVRTGKGEVCRVDGAPLIRSAACVSRPYVNTETPQLGFPPLNLFDKELEEAAKGKGLL